MNPLLKERFPQVSTVTDSKKPVDINVSYGDCRNAVPGAPDKCAIAKAVRRQHLADGAFIGLTVSYLIHGNRAIKFLTPARVQREITSFDRHGDFAHGEYRLASVPPCLRVGGSCHWQERSGRVRRGCGGKPAKRTVRVRQ